jgi:hypothetical protein
MNRCKHNWTSPPECPQCVAEERDIYRAALEEIVAKADISAPWHQIKRAKAALEKGDAQTQEPV